MYHTLNLLSIDVTHKCLVAEGWCPLGAKDKVQQDCTFYALALILHVLLLIFHNAEIVL